jgi:hypothetical protein
MNFGVIQEYEINTYIIIIFFSRNFKLRFIDIPDISDRRFLIFIKASEILYLRFKFKNLIKINFAPKIDIRINNWLATIINSLSFASINDIPLFLFDPGIKKNVNGLNSLIIWKLSRYSRYQICKHPVPRFRMRNFCQLKFV